MSTQHAFEDGAVGNPTRWSLRWDLIGSIVWLVLAVFAAVDGDWILAFTDVFVAMLLWHVYLLRRAIARLRAA